MGISPSFRRRELQAALERVAAKLPAGPVCLPLQLGRQGGVLWVLGVCPDEAVVFSTNKRAPYKCVVEVSPAPTPTCLPAETYLQHPTSASSRCRPPPPRRKCRPCGERLVLPL